MSDLFTPHGSGGSPSVLIADDPLGTLLGPPKPPPVVSELKAWYAARLESFSDGDSVGKLTDQFNANDLTQSTSSKKPTFRNNGTDNIGGHPVVDFDGSDDLLTAGSAFLSSTSGELIFVIRLRAKNNFDRFFVSPDSDNVNFRCGMRLDDSADQKWQINQDNNDTNDTVEAGAAATGSAKMIGFRSSGTAYNIRIDGTDQSLTVASGSDNGDWFGDTSNLDDVVLGGDIQGGTETAHTAVDVAEVLLYEKELTSTERSDIENWLNNVVGYGVF